MSESEYDDLDGLAGEYVLGTLSGAERTQFEARLRIDAAAARAVAEWSLRLQPLADAVAPAIPPASLWPRIAQEIGVSRAASHRRWIAAALAAAILAVALFFAEPWRQPSVTAVATLATQGGATAFTVSVLDDRAALLIRAGTVDQPANQSYELWAVPPSGAPVSLGLVSATGDTERDVPEDKRTLLQAGVTLAVSLEPEGGSTTGAPTGPVLFVGALATAQ
jgi:anti-sigma-K factor RskA